MKELNLSICAFAGALMASAGTLAENLEGARRFNHIDAVGMWIVIICVGLVIFRVLRKPRNMKD